MRLAVVGVAGRMGRMLVDSVTSDPRVRLVGALARSGSPRLGESVGAGIVATADPERAFADADGILDFTVPAASLGFARIAAERGLVHVVGTTGWSDADLPALNEAAGRARIVQSGNMSLGVNLLAGLVRRAARALGTDWDIEVLEMHHRMKVDAPSGTALLLGQAAAEGRDVDLGERSVRVRDGHTGERRAGDIGFATLRGGSVVGEHTVMLAGAGERIELTHRALDRGIFARGAVTAALWARGRPPGLYDMADVLGLN